MPRVLELYCGTKSWTKPYKKNKTWQTDTLDNDPKFKPTICENVFTWDYKKAGGYDVIYASPPCNFYFTPIKNLHGNKSFTENDVILSKKFVDKTREIINFFKPRYWVIENPVGKMRVIYPFINGVGYKTAYYCRYGFKYKKPTDIWTNVFIDFLKCNHERHEVYVKHAKGVKCLSTSAERGRIAPKLTKGFYRIINNEFTKIAIQADTPEGSYNVLEKEIVGEREKGV